MTLTYGNAYKVRTEDFEKQSVENLETLMVVCVGDRKKIASDLWLQKKRINLGLPV